MRIFRRPSKKWKNSGARLEREHAQVAIGSRAVDRSLVGVHQPVLREAMGRVFNLPCAWSPDCRSKTRSAASSSSRPPPAARSSRRQQLDGFGFDVEVLFIAKQLGYQAVEVPVRWDNVEGTKVSLLLGFAAFLDLLKVRGNGFRAIQVVHSARRRVARNC